ncbi:M12 family metallopeptidase [Dapis sp. BLCC M229]|uniref:M12 family metallopeptidase n=1 Tax=Dapis sp. BLCC M229 TaxID=3400188 RepID=UPI003CF19265
MGEWNKIHYCFFDRAKGHNSPANWTGSEENKQIVRAAFEDWKAVGIGLEFEEVDTPADAEVRIGFQQGDGSWSYVGTDVLEIPLNQRTMNFGWPLDENYYGKETALHEIGHTLGLPHEHQNPKAGIQWNEDAVRTSLSGPPNNWSPETIEYNILRKIPMNEVEGSDWDPNSIMHYQFQAELINSPAPYNQEGIFPTPGLSIKDKDWLRKFYPVLESNDYIELKPFVSVPLVLSPGEQVNFIVKPNISRSYKFQTFGEVDTVMVLFEEENGDPRYLADDDDSGTDYNALITHKLLKGRTYILRVRLYFASASGETAVMMW